MTNLLKRNYVAEFRNDAQRGYVVGMPVVFDSPTDIGGLFEETICKGAISQETLKDVRFFWNHNIDEKAIARSIIPLDKPGGMELKVTDTGLVMTMNPNRKRSDANDLVLAIEDGVISGMSFMFGVAEERWEDENTDHPKRFITRIDPVIEVSAVNFPAYDSTDIHARREAVTENDRAALERCRQKCAADAESTAKKPRKKNKYFYYYFGGK